MDNKIWKLTFAIAVIVVSIVYLIPTFKPGLWPHKKINLGLDLQGGMHLILEVDIKKAFENTIERNSQEIKDSLKREHIPNMGVSRIEGTKIAVKFKSSEEVDKFEKFLDKEFSDFRTISKLKTDDNFTVLIGLIEKEADRIKKSFTEQALETIRNRIDQFGVSEPEIRIQGENQVLVQLPGIKDVERAKSLIGKTALLEFKLVDEDNDVNSALKGEVPQISELLYQTIEDQETNRTKKTPFLIKKETLLTGTYLVDAKVQIDSEHNEPYVSIDFDKKGARIFERITEENVKKRLAIVLDNSVYSAPVIQEKISGGSARITGSFTSEEAHDLAIVLKAGALPAPVSIIEERTVGPSLGADSIKQGFISMAVGAVLVVIFMILYYRWAGVIADFALIINILLIIAGMSIFQATLTLPGIAGIILTMGMSVDANVLVYERIKEELRTGKSVRAAITAGYDRATITVLDSNITTLIAAVVLFQFGTGAVKGFAVTLTIGLITSVYTALYLTEWVYEFIFSKWKINKLSI